MNNNAFVVHDYTAESVTLAPRPDPVIGRSRFLLSEDEYGNQRTVTLVFLRTGEVLWELPETPEGLPPLNPETYFPPLKPENHWEH